MNYLLRFLLLLRPSSMERAKGKGKSSTGAITTRSLSLLFLLPFWQADRYFPRFLRAVMATGTVANRSRVCFACPNIQGAKTQ